MLAKAPIRIVTLALLLPILSCSGAQHASSTSPGAATDILSYLREPGKVTYVRYTTYTPPWPTRTEAWIDWDNNRIRAWNVQWTDSPTNPGVCTSIRNGSDWYPCLPSMDKVNPKDPLWLAFWPSIPLRSSESELSVSAPRQSESTAEARGDQQPVTIERKGTTARETQGGMQVLVTSWKIDSKGDVPCESGQSSSPIYEYTSTPEGLPVSEYITVTCGGQARRYIGVLYHEVRFVDRANLPVDFFDVNAARTFVISNELSSAAAQLPSAFWLGDQVDNWRLTDAEHRTDWATITYSRGAGDQAENVRLTTRIAGPGSVICPNAQPIPNDAYGGSLCTLDGSPPYGRYRLVWNPAGVEVFLEEQDSPEIGRDQMLALGAKLEQWVKKAVGPLLTNDGVRNFVADSLELVCPSSATAIRNATATSSFTFDRKTGEWTGAFGSFGEFAVPDAKPVAIPINHRQDVDSTLSHNGVQFADCLLNEQPTPQEGDNQFGVTFVGKDDSGFSFQVTGVDSHAEAALSVCLATDGGGCSLTAPDGTVIRGGAVNLNDVRPEVSKIHVGLEARASNRTGKWTFVIDLGDGRSAKTTFEIQ